MRFSLESWRALSVFHCQKEHLTLVYSGYQDSAGQGEGRDVEGVTFITHSTFKLLRNQIKLAIKTAKNAYYYRIFDYA